MKKANLILIIWCCLFHFSYGQILQNIPQPIDLGIRNIPQQTSSWCWAATAQQIIFWLRGYAPAQCELVAHAFGANPLVCCTNPQAYNAPGNLAQIQELILAYGGHYSSIAPPANAMALYQTLAQGKAIVLFLQTTPYIGHFVVLRGLAWVPTLFGYQAVLYINDPMSYFTQPISFYRLQGLWRAAIVVY